MVVVVVVVVVVVCPTDSVWLSSAHVVCPIVTVWLSSVHVCEMRQLLELAGHVLNLALYLACTAVYPALKR